MKKINLKRIKVAFIAFAFIMIALLARFAYIQLFLHEDFESGAISQYEIFIDGLDTRGMILDRNYMPLTGGVDQYYYFIKKENVANNVQIERENLFEITSRLQAKQIAKESSEYYVFRTEYFDENLNKELKEKYNAYVFQNPTRYSNEQTACHLIGYLNEDENMGVSGLELLFEDKLKDDGTGLSLWADASGTILVGESPKLIVNEKENTNLENQGVVTTIDRRLQFVTENALKTSAKSGAAIVMDSDTGEILAWSSMPTFNPNNVDEYLDSGSDCLINKVSQAAYAPGSVFKIVTAAAALENGLTIDEKFSCEGSVTVEGITLGCHTAPDRGHGTIDMKEAMAVSCNCYFAQLGQKIGYKSILKQAEKMGLGQVTMGDFPEESAGNLPKTQQSGTWDTSNISIGQGQILTTPLQIAQMTAMVANGGIYIKPSIVFGEERETYPVMESDTAQDIENMLEEVMKTGTAKGNWSIDVYGKTGTAEVGSHGNMEYNCWFTGYCRLEDKTYVITVLVEDGVSGTNDALPVFERISEFLQSFLLYS